MIARRRPNTARATYDDVLRAPERMVAEILNGELVLSPRPAARHAHAASRLGAELLMSHGGSGPRDGWIILGEPELHLGSADALEILVPDIAGWRLARMDEVPDTAAITVVPDWVCEILSPSTETRDRTDKLEIYAREGVAHLWLVSARTRHVEFYRLVHQAWVLIGTARDDDRITMEPFADVEIDLRRLWSARPLPPEPPPD